MIQLAHMGMGLLASRGRSGVLDALLAGVVSHGLIDVPPHGEVHDDAFEAATATVGILSIAARHGIGSPLVWGAIGGVLPDTEHVLPRAIRSPRGWFPTHRYRPLHGDETLPFRIPTWVQAVIGGAIIGAAVANRDWGRRRMIDVLDDVAGDEQRTTWRVVRRIEQAARAVAIVRAARQLLAR